jgi:succinate dehydrogenase/fumarate reductase flavoprotein subunit
MTQLQYSLIEAFYDNGSTVVDALGTLGQTSVWNAPGLGGHPHGDPDYDADLPEDKAPHGRHVRPPSGGGAGLITGLQAVANKQKIPLLLDHRVTKVFRNAKGEVVGVQALNGSKTVAIRAKKGIVFGSGGFTQNADMARTYLRGPIFGGCAVPTNTGDFVQIGIDVGSPLGNMTHAFWAENPLEQALQNSSVPNDIWLPFGDSMIYVNRYGRRVTNEKMVYNERTQVHFDWSATGREYPNLVLMMIYDSAVANNPLVWGFRYPIPMPGVSSPFVISGSTLQELSQNIDARLATYTARTGGYRLDGSFAGNLQNEVTRFNSFAAAGKDDDFRRGETEIQVAWNGPARAGNTKSPTMAPFSSSGPYYCILIGGGTLDTKGGPTINAKGQVLNMAGAPIPGLYGAGNCIASPAGQAYWSAGGTLGPALTFGYLAGANASKERVKSL